MIFFSSATEVSEFFGIRFHFVHIVFINSSHRYTPLNVLILEMVKPLDTVVLGDYRLI